MDEQARKNDMFFFVFFYGFDLSSYFLIFLKDFSKIKIQYFALLKYYANIIFMRVNFTITAIYK